MEQNALLTQLEGAINLVSMMPPSRLKKNLTGLVKIAPEIEDNLYQKVVLPMEINQSSQGLFLQTQLNRDGNSFRSPIDNKYYPSNQADAYFPSPQFREFQQMGNLLFSQYTKLYYGNDGVGSFYVLENQSNPKKFTCGYFAKKSNFYSIKDVQSEEGFEGQWNSFNVVDVETKEQTTTYSIESTAMVQMKINKQTNTNTDLTGFVTNNKIQSKSLAQVKHDEILEFHMATVGELIERVETDIRKKMDAIYIAKTREIIFSTRYEETKEFERNRYKLAQELKAMRMSKE